MTLLLVSQRKITDRRDNILFIEELKKGFSRIINISLDSYHLRGPYGDDILGLHYNQITSIKDLRVCVEKFDKKEIVLINTISENHIGKMISSIFLNAKCFNFISNENIWAHIIVTGRTIQKNKLLDIIQNPISYYYGLKQRLFKNSISRNFTMSDLVATTYKPIIFQQDDEKNTIFVPSKEYFIKKISKEFCYQYLNISKNGIYCTYIDQNFIFHPDYNGMLKKGNIDTFYETLKPLFNKLNKNNITILFTPHPSMNNNQYRRVQLSLKELNIVFLKNGTTEYAMKISDYNLGHYSIAQFYALFEQIPTLLVKFPELFKLKEDKNVELVSSILKLKAFDYTNDNINEFDTNLFQNTREDFYNFGKFSESNQYEYIVNKIRETL